jgi:hypothetical protein
MDFAVTDWVRREERAPDTSCVHEVRKNTARVESLIAKNMADLDQALETGSV